MEQQEQNDPLWDLLGRASRTEPGPFFSRNVVRTVRGLDAPSTRRGAGLFFLTRFRPALSGLAFALLVAAAVSLFGPFGSREAPTDPSSPALTLSQAVQPSAAFFGSDDFDPASELEAVEYLGQLMVVADPGQLSDEALGDLFF